MAEVPRPQSIPSLIAARTFLADRTPETSDEDAGDAFARVADYRDGAVFVGHWAGSSEWERHPVGDEIVFVVDGETMMTLLVEGEEHRVPMAAGDLVVVPRGTWHRFDTPDGLRVMSVTPQPTDHSVAHPGTT